MSSPGPTVLRLDAQNPWPGPREFTEGNAEFFHGREGELNDLLERVQSRPLTVLYGKTGLGKSSLLQAGLFRPLRALDGLPVLCKLHYDNPDHKVDEQVRRALADAYAEAGLDGPKDGESAWEFLHRREGLPKRPAGAGEKLVEPCPVLVFDQFEELFTRGAENATARTQAGLAITFLTDLIENRTPEPLRAEIKENPLRARELRFGGPYYKVVISLREDYLAQLERLTAVIPALAQNRMPLSRMNGLNALTAARPSGTSLVSEEVAEKIVRFVAGSNGADGEKKEALETLRIDPWLLCLLCYELNLKRQRDEAPQITLDLLSRNQQDIVKDFYDRCVGDDPAINRFIEDVLVTDAGTRDHVTMARAESKLPLETIIRLVNDRLLRVEDWDVRYVLLAHDALLPVAIARKRERQAREGERKRQQRRGRIGLCIVAALAVLGLIVWTWVSTSQKHTAQSRESKAQQSEAERAIKLSRVDCTVAIDNFDRGEPKLTAMYLAHALVDQNNDLGVRNFQVDLLAHDFLFRQDRPLDRVMDGLRALPRIQKEILSVCFSPDQSLVATTTTDHQVCLWRTDTCELVGNIPHPQKVHSVTFSPGGRFLVTACEDGYVRFWDTKTRDQMDGWVASAINTAADSRVVRSVRFRPTRGGKSNPDETLDSLPPLVVSCWDGNVYFRDASRAVYVAKHPQMVSRQHGARSPINKQALWCANANYSNDGDLVVAAYGDYTAHIWKLSSEPSRAGSLPEPEEVAKVQHDDWVLSAEFSDDGKKLLTASADGTARIWKVESDGKTFSLVLEHTLEHPGGTVYAAVFSPAQKRGRIIATACVDGIVRLWDAKDGRRLLELPLHGGAVRTVAFSKDGKQLVSGSVDGTVCVWPNPYASIPDLSPDPPDLSPNSKAPLDEQKDVTALAYSPDGRIVATGTTDGDVDLWDAENLKEICPGSIHHEAEVNSVAFSGNGRRLVSASEDGTVQQWDIERNASSVSLKATKSFRNLSETNGHSEGTPSAVRSAVFEPQEPYRRLLTASDDGNARFWDAQTGEHIGPPLGVASPVDTGNKPMTTHDGTVHSAVFSPDGRYVVTAGGDKFARVFDATSGRPVPSLQLSHQSSVFAAVFSPDGKEVLTACDDGQARLWSTADGVEHDKQLICGSQVRSALFTHGGVVTACANGSLQLWSDVTAFPQPAVANGVQQATDRRYQRLVFPWNHDTGIICVAIRPDTNGQLLAASQLLTITQDHKVSRWQMAPLKTPTPSITSDKALFGLLRAIRGNQGDEEEEKADEKKEGGPLIRGKAIHDSWAKAKKYLER